MRFKRPFVYFIVLSLGLSFSFSDHPFYLSVTEINYNERNHHYELSFRLFIDDFELCLSNSSGSSVYLFETKDSVRNDQFITDYINDHFKLVANSKNIELYFVGYEKEDQAVWCYFESDAELKPESIHIQNTLLYEKFESQTNIIHLIIGEKRHSYKLDNPEVDYQWSKE